MDEETVGPVTGVAFRAVTCDDTGLVAGEDVPVVGEAGEDVDTGAGTITGSVVGATSVGTIAGATRGR